VSGGIIPPFLTSAPDGGEWSASHPSHFTSGGKSSRTHWLGGWVDPGTSLDAVVYRKIPYTCWGLNPSRLARGARGSVVG
jgi:hypothetical protein